jgi:hypothetical protein
MCGSRMTLPRKKFIRFEGALPDKLYRYRTVSADTIDDRLIDFEILEEGIYLAGLHELNDPDEGRFHLSWGREYAEILAYWRRAITSSQSDYSPAQVAAEAKRNTDEVIVSGYLLPERVATYTRSTLEHVIRIACFTTLPTNFSMWANYAKYRNSEGIVAADTLEGETIVITVYEPDPALWEPGFEREKP